MLTRLGGSRRPTRSSRPAQLSEVCGRRAGDCVTARKDGFFAGTAKPLRGSREEPERIVIAQEARRFIATHIVQFEPSGKIVNIPTGALLSEALRLSGLDLGMPCGGQGRCGRCAVIAQKGSTLRRRSTMRLSQEDLAAGYALACQTVVEGDAHITVPPQEKLERRLVTDRTAGRVSLPFTYDPEHHQSLWLLALTLDPPAMTDQTDDWARLKRALSKTGFGGATISLPLLQRLGTVLREGGWSVTAVLETDTWDSPDGPPRLVDVLPGEEHALYGATVDIGTTTVSLYLVDLRSGNVLNKQTEYNDQITRGEDVISRIVYASKNNGLGELQGLVIGTINGLLERAARAARIETSRIYKVSVAGNSTMIHLLLALPPSSIRLEPFITAVNAPPLLRARELGLAANPEATVDCLPGVASYVGSDISAGVVGARMCASEGLTLFLDVGTNGEMVLGDSEWLISCACSAGPAFEGAGVQDGMRATSGAIEEVWISSTTLEPTYRVIPDPRLEVKGKQTPPEGICGSGLIALLSEMFVTGVVDRAGNLNFHLGTPRVREGAHGAEYVVAFAGETAHGRDIVINQVDIGNLMRAKGAVYAGFIVLVETTGVELSALERVLIGGSFGQYINVEKAIQIGLLPDLPWEKFQFLGNTSLQGALLALLSRDYRREIAETAAKMTYLELSADNTFYHHFMSALFLPHTDFDLFPSVKAAVAGQPV